MFASSSFRGNSRHLSLALGLLVTAAAARPTAKQAQARALEAFVNDAAHLLHTKGDAALGELRLTRIPWREGETYLFVLDLQGNVLIHPDPALQGKNLLSQVDVDGRPITRGLIDTATAERDKPEGWYRYRWRDPATGRIRWKSTYVRLTTDTSGKPLVLGAGMFDDAR
jgi:signal transduction histidine kinase